MQKRHFKIFFQLQMITSERFVTNLELVATQIALEDLGIYWFIQDGARRHRTEKMYRFLYEYFENRIIELEYPKFIGTGVNWPPCLTDLTPYDYFL
ncbi:uncharacterized protein NPIL_536621 [Nephila pilipes]|uniref:Uncharacterized protein n=1 Tax=Nephila pilipes TaxID=299642 RepID=A0A8X6PDT3_NEPPI|nr:uncharacterized protein NPIL_536621 [Nephila pilipes]